MLNETYRRMLDHKSVIRETFMYGRRRAAGSGPKMSLIIFGQPQDRSLSAPADPGYDRSAGFRPTRWTARLLPQPGGPGLSRAVAAQLERQFGLPYTPEHIFPTTGAAGAIAHAVRAISTPGEQVLTFAPFFPEYRAVCGWHRCGTGRRAPADAGLSAQSRGAGADALPPAPPVC